MTTAPRNRSGRPKPSLQILRSTPGTDVLRLAEEVILAAEAEDRPADEVLRHFFKQRMRSAHGPLPSRQVACAVFDYFRWRGWTRPGQAISEALRKTSELAIQFATTPAAFSDSELKNKALPSWVAGEVEITTALARALQALPRLWLRARAGQGPAVAELLGDCKPLGPGRLCDALEYRGHKDVFRTSVFLSGGLEIQDASSQAVGLLCDPKPGETWWDACAGEGGKSLHLSDLMGNKGLIWATDRAEWRLRKLRARAARAKVFNYRVAEWDGGPKLPTRTKFDGVLIDAPCSGIGTWGRNPHARWTTSLNDVHDLAKVQARLVEHACTALKPGGKLVYSVCTLTRSETNAVADQFEKAHPEFRPLRLPNPLNPSGSCAERHWFMPQDYGTNGMFVAVWTRP